MIKLLLKNLTTVILCPIIEVEMKIQKKISESFEVDNFVGSSTV